MSDAVLISPLENPQGIPHTAVLRIHDERGVFITYDDEEDATKATEVGYSFFVENMIIGLMGFLSNSLQPVPLTIPSADGSASFVFDVHYAVVENINDEATILLLMRIDGDEYLLNERVLLTRNDQASVEAQITNMIWSYVYSISLHMSQPPTT